MVLGWSRFLPPYDHCTGELDPKISAKSPKLSRSKWLTSKSWLKYSTFATYVLLVSSQLATATLGTWAQAPVSSRHLCGSLRWCLGMVASDCGGRWGRVLSVCGILCLLSSVSKSKLYPQIQFNRVHCWLVVERKRFRAGCWCTSNPPFHWLWGSSSFQQ